MQSVLKSSEPAQALAIAMGLGRGGSAFRTAGFYVSQGLVAYSDSYGSRHWFMRQVTYRPTAREQEGLFSIAFSCNIHLITA